MSFWRFDTNLYERLLYLVNNRDFYIRTFQKKVVNDVQTDSFSSAKCDNNVVVCCCCIPQTVSLSLLSLLLINKQKRKIDWELYQHAFEIRYILRYCKKTCISKRALCMMWIVISYKRGREREVIQLSSYIWLGGIFSIKNEELENPRETPA